MLDHPFVVEHRLAPDPQKRNSFTPEARLFISPTLRTSGLLGSLNDHDIRNLVWLLTYFTPNGYLIAPLASLAKEMQLAERVVRKQFAQLAAVRWQGSPIIHHLVDNDLERFVLDPQILGAESLEVNVPVPEYRPLPPGGYREEIVQASRAAYARPRAEVERIVLEQLGHHPEEEENTPEGEVRRGLRDAGVSRDLVASLLEEYGLEACQRQLEWLPLRSAKSPGRYIVAAIEGNYGPPRGIRPFVTPGGVIFTNNDSHKTDAEEAANA